MEVSSIFCVNFFKVVGKKFGADIIFRAFRALRSENLTAEK